MVIIAAGLSFFELHRRSGYSFFLTPFPGIVHPLLALHLSYFIDLFFVYFRCAFFLDCLDISLFVFLCYISNSFSAFIKLRSLIDLSLLSAYPLFQPSLFSIYIFLF